MFDLHIRIIHKGSDEFRVEALTPEQEGATDIERRLAQQIALAVADHLKAKTNKCYVAAGTDREQLERELDIQKSLDPEKFS